MQALYQLSYSPLRCSARFPGGDANITGPPGATTKSFPVPPDKPDKPDKADTRKAVPSSNCGGAAPG